MRNDSDRQQVMCVLGEGGHTTELLNLIDLLGDAYAYRYVVSEDDDLSTGKIRIPGPVYRLKRPRNKRDLNLLAGIRLLAATLKAFRIVGGVRPFAIISSGPAIAVPICLAGKFWGSKIIFIETGSRVSRLSGTGRIVYHLADLFFVQWPELKCHLAKAIYAGRLM